ncbi:MAG TPA: type II secretion system protein [Burkholderiales bacterium]|nr:type II secretion system protein [Burkholderiales bacterium]
MQKQSGFTLVEIAIVLVIIGLILAAVLKGQEMITQGKIKGAINDFNAVMTAYNGYQDRYRAIPGDDPNASARWTTAGFTPTGATVGNGIVDGNYNDSAAAPSEANFFWMELRLANFYTGSTASASAGLTQPENAVGGIIGVQNGALGMSGLSICMSAVVYKIAQAVDTQLDDGHAATGTLRAVSYTPSGTSLPSLASTPTADYADGSTYVLCRSVP